MPLDQLAAMLIQAILLERHLAEVDILTDTAEWHATHGACDVKSWEPRSPGHST